VFTWILQVLATADLVNGKTIGVDATTLEANAALRSIVRRDSGETYQEFLTRLAQASGIETPSRADLARLDRKRPKKGRNTEWRHPHDPDARITKMKDGRTHLAHKAEHAVDLETGAIVGVTVQGADHGDTTTIAETSTRRSSRRSSRTRDITAIRCSSTSRRSTCGRISQSPTAVAADGETRRRRGTRSTRIAGASVVRAGERCNADRVNDWNDPTPISTKPVACAAPICVAA
jgi:hypothetical protein